MKRTSIFLKVTALLLAFLLFAAGCGRTGGSASGGAAKDPADAGNTLQSSVSEEESAAEETGESGGEEAAERTPAEPVRVVEGIEYGPTIFGTRMVSFLDAVFFATKPGDDEYMIGSEYDGLYMATPAMESPVRLAQGKAGPIWINESKIYFYNQTPLKNGICRVGVDGEEMEWIAVAGQERPIRDLFVLGDEAVFVRDGVLVFLELNGADNWTETTLKPDEGEILMAKPGPEGIYYSLFDPETGKRKIFLFNRENTSAALIAEPDTYGFTPYWMSEYSDYAVYYLSALPDQPLYEDYRQYEFELMRAEPDGTCVPTGLTGRFGDELFCYMDYIFYTKYQEVQEWGGSDRELTVSRPYCYNPMTGQEYAIDRDTFTGWDVRLVDVAGGCLYLDVYDVRTDEWGEFMYSLCEDLTQDKTGIVVWAEELAARASLSPAFVKEQEAAAIEAAKTEEERAAEEEERRRQEEEALKNEPYGPGTSSLYLKAGDLSACFRLVRMDGSTEFQVLLGPGEHTTMSFPCGRYVLKIAKGETWISDEEAFGPDGKYSSTNVFRFESGAAYEISTGTRGDFHGDSQAGFTG